MYGDNMTVCPYCLMINNDETRTCYNCGGRLPRYRGVRNDTPAKYWPKDEEDRYRTD